MLEEAGARVYTGSRSQGNLDVTDTESTARFVETNFSKVRFKGDEERANSVYSNVALGGPLNADDMAECILFALTRRPNVNIDEIVVMALAQVSGSNILRDA